MDLCLSFYEYYKNQDLDSECRLLEAIADSDLSQIKNLKRLFNQSVNIKNTQRIFNRYTSGTSGIVRQYFFYDFKFWVRNIENLIKRKNPNVIYVTDGYDFRLHRLINRKWFVKSQGDFKTDYYCMVPPDQVVSWIEFNAKSLYPITLWSYPCFFLQHLEKLQTILQAPNNALSTDYDAFFKRYGVWVDDNMIDWETGLNFYTCIYGQKHSYPIFYTENGLIRNLLNLCSTPIPVSDYFKITGPPQKCMCGKDFVPFEFIPHYKYAITKNNQFYYDLELANRLRSNLKSIQFIQEHDEILIIYRGHMESSDKSTLTDWWRERGFTVRFVPNSYLITGGCHKLATFFNNTIIKKKVTQLYLFP